MKPGGLIFYMERDYFISAVNFKICAKYPFLCYIHFAAQELFKAAAKAKDRKEAMSRPQNIFESDNVRKTYFYMVIPVVCGMVISLIYNLTDTYFVAQTQNTDLVAGVSLGAPVFTFLMALGNIFGQGGTSLMSRLMGEKEKEKIGKISSFCFWAAILLGVLVGIILLIFRNGIVWMLGADEGTFEHAMAYYVVLACGSPAILVNFIHLNLLRAEGMSRQSMTGSILGSVVNIVLDPVMILILGMGAAGAALASVIGYTASSLYFAVIVVKKSRVMSIRPRLCRVNKHELFQILSVGIPASLSNIMSSVAMILVNQFLLPYGSDKIAAMGIAMKVNMVVLLLLVGLTSGSISVYGYYFGAGEREKMNRLLRFQGIFIAAVSIILSAALFAAAKPLIRFFMDDDGIVEYGSVMLRCLVITSVLTGIILMIQMICQALGEAAGAMILTLSRQGVVFLIALFICRAAFGYTGILIAQPAADALTFVIALFIYRLRLKKHFT